MFVTTPKYALKAIATLITLLVSTMFAFADAAPTEPLGASVHKVLTLPPIFSDNMVLEQGKCVVWGSGEPWGVVTVVVGSVTATAKAGSSGWWRADLKGLKAPGPYNMIVTDGSTTLTFKNVGVGQVWVCAGSSVLNVSSTVPPAGPATPAAGDVRFFKIAPGTAYKPVETVAGQWEPAPSTSASAIGALFASQLSQRLNMPVGIVQATIPGAPAEAFVPIDALEGSNELSPTISWYDRNRPAKDASDSDASQFANRLPAGAWNAMVAPIVPYTIAGVVPSLTASAHPKLAPRMGTRRHTVYLYPSARVRRHIGQPYRIGDL